MRFSRKINSLIGDADSRGQQLCNQLRLVQEETERAITPIQKKLAGAELDKLKELNIEALKEEIRAEALLAAHPVGSYYMSDDQTPPSELFGGTWVQIKGRFIMGTGVPEANTHNNLGSFAGGGYNDGIGQRGGALQHLHGTGNFALAEAHMPSHRHYFDTNGGGQHSHGIAYRSGDQTASMSTVLWEYNSASFQWYNPMQAAGWHGHNGNTAFVGGGAAHNHGNTNNTYAIPPYVATNIWKRTA